MDQRWEYLFVEPAKLEPVPAGADGVTAALNQLGHEGWELVAVQPGTSTGWYFKRGLR